MTEASSKFVDMDLAWIVDGLKRSGKKKSDLAQALGIQNSGVTSLLKGERRLRADEVAKIARFLGIEAPISLISPDLLDGEVRQLQPKPRTRVSVVMIKGEVAAGVWAQSDIHFNEVAADIAHDIRWPSDAVFALRVRGTSINRQAKEGDLVLCLDAWAAPRSFQHDDWVVVERDRDGLIETTVKRVRKVLNGSWMLVPDSDDPQFQDPVLLSEEADGVVRVRAFVLQFVSQGTRF